METGGETGVTKIILVSCNFANAPTNEQKFYLSETEEKYE